MKYIILSFMLLMAACQKQPCDMSAESPRYSFVRIDTDPDSTCSTAPATCLPISDLSDIQFQLITDFVENPTPGYTNFFIAIPCSACNELTEEELVQIIIGNGTPAKRAAYAEELGEDSHLWNFIGTTGSSNDIDIAEGECFHFCIYQLLVTDAYDIESIDCMGLTNCFRKVSELCNTSVIEYQNDEDALGFYASAANRVRLPIKLQNMQLPGEEKGYQKSDGTFLKLSERINKQWDLITDYIPDEWHDRLRIALSCDTITITNTNANVDSVEIYRSEGYEIGEPNAVFPDFPIRQARTKVLKKQLLASVNSNCG